MSDINIILLAGGKGERMEDISKRHQKCIMPVNKKPVLTYVLENISDAFGSANVIISVGYKSNEIIEKYGTRFKKLNIKYENDKIPSQGVRLSVLQSAKNFNNPFFVISGDVIIEAPHLKQMANDFKSDILGIVSGATDHLPALTHATIRADNNMRILEIDLSPKQQYSGLYRSTSYWLLSEKMVKHLEDQPESEKNISPVIQQLVKKGEKFLLTPYVGEWQHIFSSNQIDSDYIDRL